MIFGAITNSWREQLLEQDLPALVKEAVDRGAKHVELRQTCLGACETGSGDVWLPDLDRLSELVGGFPELTFDLAMAWPCLTKETDPDDPQFQAALDAAILVGGDNPHLRLVDPSPFDHAWDKPEDIPAEALAIVSMAREAARRGVTLSMENSGQPIRSMAMLVSQARDLMSPDEGSLLGLCPDPTNQLRRFPDSDPLAELAALTPDMLKIVHIKQARDGQSHPTVDTGDLDCQRMLRVLEEQNYQGALIMEIPPHPEVMDNLSASFSYLESAREGR